MFTFHARGCARVSGWFWCESISGHPMQKLRSFCRVHNASRMLRRFIYLFILMRHPLLWRKHKQASGEHCRHTWSQTVAKKLLFNSSTRVQNPRSRQMAAFVFVIEFGFTAARSFPCPPSGGSRSPQSVTPHEETAFAFFWASRACTLEVYFLKWLIAFIQVLLFHLSRAFVQFPVLPRVVHFSCQKKTKKNRCIMFLLDTNGSSSLNLKSSPEERSEEMYVSY